MLGLSLLYVGAVVAINGLWLLDKVEEREVFFMNAFTGFITLCVALYTAFGPNSNLASINSAALTLLFSATYLWVAFNRVSGADGRGLGWFCLFVAITVIPVTISAFEGASNSGQLWLAICWLVWAVLWFVFFLLLALRKPIARFTGAFCIVAAIGTAWMPGLFILNGMPI